jgi:hypothetical protein
MIGILLQRHDVPPGRKTGITGLVWQCDGAHVGGLSALKAILGNMLAPGHGDRLLAHEAYAGQITSQPLPPDEPGNLIAPVATDHAAHGRFDATARDDVVAVNPAALRGRRR